MICYASLALFVYNVLKLLTYHMLFYWQPLLSYQRSNRSGFFDPPCICYGITQLYCNLDLLVALN